MSPTVSPTPSPTVSPTANPTSSPTAACPENYCPVDDLCFLCEAEIVKKLTPIQTQKTSSLGIGSVCHSIEVNAACSGEELCAFEATSNNSYCVDVILLEDDAEVKVWADTADGVSSTVAVVILAGGVATGSAYIASAGIQGASSAVGNIGNLGNFKIDFDPSALVSFAQLAVMSAQMDLPHVPDTYYGWASSFSWASLNFGILGPRLSSSESSASRRALEADDAGTASTSTGFEKYCAMLHIDQQYLFLDVLAGFLLLCVVAVWAVVLVRSVLKCLEKRLGPEKVKRMWERTDIVKLLVMVAYYGFYPFMMSIFFQLAFHASLSGDDERLMMARIISSIAVICFIFECMWVISAAVAVHKVTRKVSNAHPFLERLAVLQTGLMGERTQSLTKHWKRGCRQWWVLKIMKMTISALVVTYIFSPKPFQPILILSIAVGYLALLMIYEPYADAFQNDTRIVYSFLGVINSSIFVVYGLESINISDSALSFLGKVQMGVNMAMMVALILCQFAKRKEISTCTDFGKWLTCRHSRKTRKEDADDAEEDAETNVKKKHWWNETARGAKEVSLVLV